MTNDPPSTPRSVQPREDLHEPIEVFKEIAIKHGLIRPGDPLDRMVIDALFDVVERCAAIGDGYGDGEAGGNAGEHIRAVLGDV